ncbi:MAG: hypothetical protein QOJ25_2937 [Solirubrobacteraceae bacterium]|jgi:hypothetical protein|nr:hypothetical protein [Solirubrobacteraceae bacterium]
MTLVDHDQDQVPGFKLRLRVWLRRPRLDRELARGRGYKTSPALALRARQLVETSTRRRAARNLRDIVNYAERAAAGRIISAVVIERAAVRAGREALLGLADRLDGTAPVSPRGVARVQILLTDGCESPLFNPHTGYTVVDAVWQAAELLGAGARIDAAAF